MYRNSFATILILGLLCISCKESAKTPTRNTQPTQLQPIIEDQPPTSKQAPSSQPTVASLTENPVVGALGVPLGTVVEIKATVVDGGGWRSKGKQGIYHLRVTEVDGHPIEPPPIMEFTVLGFVDVELASNIFDLYEMKTGEKTGQLEPEQIEELQKDYIGKQERLIVYEIGQYSGIPRNLPKDVPMWQDHGFSFWTSLVLLAERP